MYGVYIIKGLFYYVGCTGDLNKRLQEHREGRVITTSKIGNFKLMRRIECEGYAEARKIEAKIKKGGHYERRIVNQ